MWFKILQAMVVIQTGQAVCDRLDIKYDLGINYDPCSLGLSISIIFLLTCCPHTSYDI
jgi:hypothetical protein